MPFRVSKPLLALLISFISGLLLPLATAPFDWWPIGIISAAALAYCLQSTTAKQGFLIGWSYGSAAFLAGVSWVYIAMYEFGETPAYLAIPMTAIFCIFLGLFTAGFAYSYVRWLRAGILGNTLGFAVAWVLFEWLRGWLFTGFPWLYLGYAHLSSPLAGWAPILGVYGLSFFVALSAACLCVAITKQTRYSRSTWLAAIGCLGIFLAGEALKYQEWTRDDGRPALRVSTVQANISQDKKWAYNEYWSTLERYDLMSEPLWPDSDVVIWPEAAIPALYHQAASYFDYIRQRAEANDTALISGVPTLNGDDYFNSVLVVAGGQGIYHKQRLVPFGEYVPLDKYIRGLIKFFDLPMSSFTRGGPNQQALQVKDWRLAPSICYEVVYPDLIADGAKNADILFTISNDAWFGRSIGPSQHMQMAQMRALENGRPLIRATSTGISALVNHRGQITASVPPFEQTALRGEVQGRAGQTPFNRLGSLPTIGFCLTLFVLITISAKKSPRPR